MSQTTTEIKKAELPFPDIKRVCRDFLGASYSPMTVYAMLTGRRAISPVVESAVRTYKEYKEKHYTEIESVAAAFRRTHLPQSLNNA